MMTEKKKMSCVIGTPALVLGVMGIFSFLLFAACDEPGPLFGTWMDNKGNSLTFNTDNTFTARIYYGLSEPLSDGGQFSLLQNSLTLKCVETQQTIVTEWDIRGNILYLYWLTEDNTMLLTLFKVAN